MNKRNLINLKHFSSQVTQSNIVSKSETSKEPVVPLTEVTGVESSYINLLNTFIAYLPVKDANGNILKVSITADMIKSLDGIDSIPLDVKKFCSDIRVSNNTEFGRNVMEILLFPISKNVVVKGKALYLSKSYLDHYDKYKELIQNEKVRQSILQYIDQLPDLRKGIVTTRTTLRSYKQDTTVKIVNKQVREDSINLQTRYLFLGLFLESLLYEVVDNSTGNRSKAIIVNYLINILSKTISAPLDDVKLSYKLDTKNDSISTDNESTNEEETLDEEDTSS